MSWKRPVSICILAMMAALPVSGAVCTMLCDSPRSNSVLASGHHHGTKHAAAPASASNEAQIQGVSQHDCSNHDAAVRQVSTTAAERADWGTTVAPLLTTVVQETSETLTKLKPHFEYSAPPGTAPPTTTPLVLRV